MGLRLFSGLLGGVSVLLVASLSQAQCSKDTDCKGDRICEAGACVTPPIALPPAPAAPEGATAVVAAPPEVASAPPPSSKVAPPVAEAPTQEVTKPKMQRHSKGMMVGGIVMTSLVVIPLFVSMLANIEQSACEGGIWSTRTSTEYRDCSSYDKTIYGGLLVGAGLLAVGIPMIVIGAKKEPVATATVKGWVTPEGGGLGLRVDL